MRLKYNLNPRHRFVLHLPIIAICLMAGLTLHGADKSITVCEICDGEFKGTIVKFKDPIRQETRFICEDCYTLDDECTICGLPAHQKNRRQLDDGRYLCRWDKDGAIVDQSTARLLFDQTKMEVRSLLAHWPPIPGPNVTFHLVNQDQFTREYMNSPKISDPQHLLGLTVTRSVVATNFVHHIYVLSGLRPSHFQAVCAHELAHVWQNEHASKTRRIHHDTEEGFCDWIAHKVMASKNDPVELTRLEESPYTQGQINALLAAEKEYQFYRVIDWLQHGVDSWVDEANLHHILDVKKTATSAPEAPRFFMPVKTPVPDTLILKGISRVGKSSFVLINNKTLGLGEKGKVRVGDETVSVTCLSIQEQEVTIQVEGESEPRTLSLSPPLRSRD